MKARKFACERCCSKDVLQVHHPEYGKHREPWEYAVDFCEVLCRKCHAEEHGLIPPRSGWILLYSDLDNNCPSEPIECANCHREVTWHFIVFHPDWGEWIVGSGCAETLSLGPEVKNLQSFQRRLNTFFHSPRWEVASDGLCIMQSGERCLIVAEQGSFRLRIGRKLGKELYPGIEEAKFRAFEVFEARKFKGQNGNG